MLQEVRADAPAPEIMKIRSLWEEGIHPPEPRRLKFFNKERSEIIKRCWRRFCERIGKKPLKIEARKPVERRSSVEASDRSTGFSGESSAVVDEAKWSRFWSWRRVVEWERQMNYEERYEQLVKEIRI